MTLSQQQAGPERDGKEQQQRDDATNPTCTSEHHGTRNLNILQPSHQKGKLTLHEFLPATVRAGRG
jgi:hypothetical protein